MTTLEKLERELTAALLTEASFRVAKSDLRLQNLIKNGSGELSDCTVSLCDDQITVLMYCNWSCDARTVGVSFEMGAPMSEDAFHANSWAARLMRGD
jgi:hypothetical protein